MVLAFIDILCKLSPTATDAVVWLQNASQGYETPGCLKSGQWVIYFLALPPPHGWMTVCNLLNVFVCRAGAVAAAQTPGLEFKPRSTSDTTLAAINVATGDAAAAGNEAEGTQRHSNA